MRFFLTLALLGVFINSAGAEVITSIDASAAGVFANNANNYHGYRFTLSAPATIGSLGWYDAGGDGLDGATSVGLWSIGGSLLADATVAAGTADPLSNGFRWHDLDSPLSLLPGDYVLAGGTQGGDEYLFSNTNFTFATFDPIVTFVEDRWSSGNTPAFPTNVSGGYLGWIGPNADFAPVPEPASLALWSILGTAGLGYIRSRRRKQST